MFVSFKGVVTAHDSSNRRPLSGLNRKRAKNALLSMKPQTLLNDMANDLMIEGDDIPPILPTLQQLQKAHSESNLLHRLSTDVFEALSKFDATHPDFIHDFGGQHFYIYFWSKFQMSLYNKICKSKSAVLAIDATGSVVQHVKRPKAQVGYNIVKKPVFYYAGVTNGLPVVQMLSERHDTVSITNWLERWRYSGAVQPAVVVTDQSRALISACSKAFNCCSTSIYLDLCMRCLISNSLKDLPATCLRIDCAHVMHTLAGIKCLKNVPRLVKKFYMHACARIITATDIESVMSLFRNLCFVALSEITTVAVDNSLISLKKAISMIDNLELEACISDNDSSQCNTDCIFESSNEGENGTFSEMGTNVLNQVMLEIECVESQVESLNAFFVAELPNALIKCLWEFLPLTTGIMMPFFKLPNTRASSAAVESHFKYVKTNMLCNVSCPVPPDVFLYHYFNALSGLLKLRGQLEDYPESSLQNEVKNANSQEDLQYQENWRGKTSASKPTYFDANCNWTPLGAPLQALHNANQLKPSAVNGQLIQLSNTCAFDAIFSAFHVGCLDSPNYFAAVTNSLHDMSIMLNKMPKHGPITAAIYSSRARILHTAFAADVKACSLTGLLSLDCYLCVEQVAAKLCANFFPLKQISSCNNVNCLQPLQERFVPVINISLLSPDNVSNLQTEVQKYFLKKVSFCSVKFSDLTCSSLREMSVVEPLPPHLLICPSLYFTLNTTFNMTDDDKPVFVKVKMLPEKITLLSATYHLRGAVAYTSGHFVCVVRRLDGRFTCVNDLGPKISHVSGDYTINLRLIIYTL